MLPVLLLMDLLGMAAFRLRGRLDFSTGRFARRFALLT